METENKIVEISPQPATEPQLPNFPQFSTFPTELRLKIWLHALPDSKVVEIEWCDKIKTWVCPRDSRNAISGLAYATTESREVYLQHYRHFLTQVPSSRGQGTCVHNAFRGPKTYFDPRIDIVYIGANSENEYCFCPQALTALNEVTSLANIQVLACELREWIDGTEEYLSQPYAVFTFPAKFILAWGDIDYEQFEKAGGRPAGEIKLVELSAEEKACSRVTGLEELYEKEASRPIPSPTKSSRVPPLTLMRITRGGMLMEHALGL